MLCADIPYYKFFKSRLTTSVLLWLADFKQSIQYVFADRQFYFFMVLFISVIIALAVILVWLKKKILETNSLYRKKTSTRMVYFLITVGLIIYAARGFNKNHPPQIKEAFFSKNVFINQLTLNPVHTFFESLSLFKIDYMPEDKAITLAQNYLGIKTIANNFSIANQVENDAHSEKKNIVLVLMESMSANRMKYGNSKKNLTPFLDSLSEASLFFSDFYSCGIHTCNGVYGTLCSFPSLMAIHPMSNVLSSNLHFDGILNTLKDNGYTNMLFCTHDDQFDNMNYFLLRNGMDKIYGSKDYPKAEMENVWGVNDEFLFDFSLKKTDSLSLQNKPFFTTILTISTHPPYQTPTRTTFKPKSKEVFDQVYEYADFALQQFFEKCKAKKWFNNTIFVFVADHGINLPSNLEAPLSFNHVPLLIYCSDSTFSAAQNKNFGMQTDIYPTLMDMVGISYVNNTLGVNLLKHKRPFAYFSQDNRLCVIGPDTYLVIDKYGSEYVYKRKPEYVLQPTGINSVIVDSMKSYAYSMLQTTQYLIEKKLVGKNN